MVVVPVAMTAVAKPLTWFTRSYLITSLLPASIPVMTGFILFTAGAWSGNPHWRQALEGLLHRPVDENVTVMIALGLLSLIVSIVTQPLQATLRQLLVGEWDGASTRLIDALTAGHLTRHQALDQHVRRTSKALRERKAEVKGSGGSPDDDLLVTQLKARYERLARLRGAYPSAPERIRPTRVGNVMSRYQSDSGLPYGLDLLAVAPLLRLVLPKDHLQRVDDARLQFDLTVRLYGATLLTTVLCLGWLWRAGGWLALALIPYLIAVALNRGTASAAEEYCSTLEVVLHADRHLLYEQLRLAPVPDAEQERRQNLQLTMVLNKNWPRHDRRKPTLRYTQPTPAPASSPKPEPDKPEQAEKPKQTACD